MSELKSRADLFEAAAKMMRMCDEAVVEPAFKWRGTLHRASPNFTGPISDYEFPLAIVEGKPVFMGDKIYDKFGNA